MPFVSFVVNLFPQEEKEKAMQRTRMLVALVLWCLVAQTVWAAKKPAEVGPHLQQTAVTIKKGSDRGSGTVIAREVEGKRVNWILTAAHVVDDLR